MSRRAHAIHVIRAINPLEPHSQPFVGIRYARRSFIVVSLKNGFMNEPGCSSTKSQLPSFFSFLSLFVSLCICFSLSLCYESNERTARIETGRDGNECLTSGFESFISILNNACKYTRT